MLDDAAAQADVAAVEHHRLAGRYRALRLVEDHADAATGADLDEAALIGLPIPGLGGAAQRQLGAVAVAMRKHAQLNPAAFLRGKELTMEQYLASPMLADPYRVADCCLETDGAAAFIV